MKTLQIGMTASPTRGGGLDRYFFNLLGTLPGAGVESVGFVAGDPAAIPRDAVGVESFAPLESSMMKRLGGLRKSISSHVAECDVIVSHFALYALPVLDLVKDRPLVVHFHGPWKAESIIEGDSAIKGSVKGFIEKVVYARGNRFIVLSQAFADILSETYGVSRANIRIVPGGVDLRRFDRAATQAQSRASLGWPVDRPIVFSVRRLVKAKGLENLIEAAQAVVDKIPDVLFMIAGTGPLAQALQRSIEERNLGEHVRLCGFIPEELLPAAYHASDLFVVPTIALEGFGLVVVESLACGTPALVTPVGGLPEVVSDLDRRLIFDGLAANDIARGIIAALAPDGPSSLPTRDECKAYAQQFDWRRVAERVAAVYREVI